MVTIARNTSDAMRRNVVRIELRPKLRRFHRFIGVLEIQSDLGRALGYPGVIAMASNLEIIVQGILVLAPLTRQLRRQYQINPLRILCDRSIAGPKVGFEEAVGRPRCFQTGTSRDPDRPGKGQTDQSFHH